MGYFSIVSLTGFPHAACLIEYGKPSAHKWYGWVPGRNQYVMGAVGDGFLDESAMSRDVGNYARWEITDLNLQITETNIRLNYPEGSGYELGRRDCITLASDAAGWAGLWSFGRRHFPPLTGPVPNPLVGNFPYEAVLRIGSMNPIKRTHFGSGKPYPWDSDYEYEMKKSDSERSAEQNLPARWR